LTSLSLTGIQSSQNSLNSGGASVFITISFTKLIHLSNQTYLKLEPLEFLLSIIKCLGLVTLNKTEDALLLFSDIAPKIQSHDRLIIMIREHSEGKLTQYSTVAEGVDQGFG